MVTAVADGRWRLFLVIVQGFDCDLFGILQRFVPSAEPPPPDRPWLALGSQAERAGLRLGYAVVAVDGHPIAGRREMRRELARRGADSEVAAAFTIAPADQALLVYRLLQQRTKNGYVSESQA